MCLVLTFEYNLIRPTVCYYTEDNKPLIIFDINNHCFKQIQVLANRGHLGSNLKITQIC